MSWMKIVGVGMVNCLGGNARDVFSAMCDDETGFREITRFEPLPYAQRRAGHLSESVESLLREKYGDDDLAIGMMKEAGSEALSSVHRDGGGALGLVLATNFGPMETLEWAWRERLDTGALDEASYSGYGDVVDIIGETFRCDGPRVQLSMSCASGGAAVCAAKDLLCSGRASRVLVLAYDSLTEYCWCGLSNLRTITADTMRPFDARRSGTVFGEGAAAFVLSAVESDEALAWLAGAATNNNAFHLTAPCKEGEGSRRVMASALADAGLAPSDIDHICAHGTSTHANDETEAAAVRNLFGERAGTLSFSAHKSQLGHLLGAAGLTEAIVTVLAMRSGMVPGTVNCVTPDAACAPLRPVNHAHASTIGCAVTNSAGIGGNNAALVISSQARVHASRGRRAPSSLYVREMGWVLPSGTGQGGELIRHPEWLDDAGREGKLAGFSAKPYLSSVKGYLDAAGAYVLAAFSLAGAGRLGSDSGICTLTQFGACGSAFAFFEQLAKKGPRFASPMVFPHGYANTAGNLAAMEFGLGGAHQVLSGKQDARELLEQILVRFAAEGASAEMMAGVYEAADYRALPDGRRVLNGALALRLADTPSESDVCVLSVDGWRSREYQATGHGSLADFIRNVLLP